MLYAVDGQLLWIKAFNASGYVEDNQDQITCDLKIDNAEPVPLGHPMQSLSKRGDYFYTLTLEQTTGHALKPLLSSLTPGVQVVGVPDIIYTSRSPVDATQAKQDEILARLDAVGAGTGSETYVLTLTSGGLPVNNAACYVTSDLEGVNRITGTYYTNDLGQVSFALNPGTYYVWANHVRTTFSQPITITVDDV